MSKIEESVEVDVPLSTVYDQWTRFAEFPRFMGGVQRIDQLSPTLTHWVTSVDGVHREFDARITEQVPDDRIAWTSVNGPEQRGVVTFHRIDDNRTKVMLQLDHEPHGVVDTVGDLLGFVSHQVQHDLGEFKKFIEEQADRAAAFPDSAQSA
ncbi:SRPBCC family protein [Streptacidiphilus sp. PAMC 29251]